MSSAAKILTLLCLSLTLVWGRAESVHYVYLSDHRIITLELVDSNNLILNYINLGDSFEMLQAPMVALVDSSDRHYNGHLISLEENSDAGMPYMISDLMKPGEFVGYLIVGDFKAKDPIERSFLQISGRILELEPLSADEFELVAARIGELDLAAEDRKWALERAGFSRGFGEIVFAGTDRANIVEKFFSKSDVIAPVPLANPSPRLPTSEAARSDPVMVRVKAAVSRHGGLHNVQVVEGINDRLDQIAVETVRNSWVFLPAISNNEIVDSQVTLNILFKRSQ